MRTSSPPRGRPSHARVGVSLACLAALLAACGTAHQSATLPRQTSTATGSAGAPTSTAEVDVDRPGMSPAVVTGVRHAAHDTYDRVVVDLKGDVPGYNVKWVDELVQDGSGRPIDVRGGAYLQLTLFPANAHDDDGKATWSGGPVYPAKLGNLTGVVRTGDFEGRVGIGLVLSRRAGFRLTEQGSPSRLILDVAH
ncbi:AMIN-like domain-containing (lipo)protein [[Actinomadura] parvosata]|uniref:AMIN-like domain-containing (lipo)protein n=1 Tax=[Actinomadura] parvosata TaxID=1955412 RepID=UPI00406CEAB6